MTHDIITPEIYSVVDFYSGPHVSENHFIRVLLGVNVDLIRKHEHYKYTVKASRDITVVLSRYS